MICTSFLSYASRRCRPRTATTFLFEKITRSAVTTRNREALPLARRTVLSGAAALLLAAVGNRSAHAQSGPAHPAAAAALDPLPRLPTPQFNAAFAKVVGDGTPIEGQMTLDLPEDAENGNIVPYRIAVESPMTEADHVMRLHLFSTQNPQAAVATFHFTPLSGKAAVSGRMRLAKTQEVVAVALTSANTLLIARTSVNVGIGGCGTE
ncbi:MAG: thiosulfate oxidation carrier protein SoxY [Rhizobiales bacterium]|nr:thiosulfate oxidation carrier protein SoxY [Hyphomicrobiales bacterium]